MAIKAAEQITITDLTDVKSVCRYYLLQSSTLDAPSKPNTNPPPSTWTKTEPSYTAGSTNSLYFTDLTVYSNDTFDYSEVSLSSSYEAAKTAYNKAVEAAKSAADAIKQATDAEKVATNFLEFTNEGLIVGNLSEQEFELLSDGENQTVVKAAQGDVLRIVIPYGAGGGSGHSYEYYDDDSFAETGMIQSCLVVFHTAMGVKAQDHIFDITVKGNYSYHFPAYMQVYKATAVVGKNVAISSNGVDIRSGKTILASFYAKLIELGKNATDAVIKLCGGKGEIKYDSTQEGLMIGSDKIGIMATDLEEDGKASVSVEALASNNSTTCFANIRNSVRVNDDSSHISLQAASYDVDDMEGTYSCGAIDLDSNGYVDITATDVTINADTFMFNDVDIGSLESKLLDGQKRDNIAADEDLNTYLTVGFYRCSLSATVQTLANCPTTDIFNLDVISTNGITTINASGWTYITQIIRCSSGIEWFRKISTNATGNIIYGKWSKVLNNVNDGFVQAGSVVITPSAKNTPTLKAVTFPTAFSSAPIVVASARSNVVGTVVTGCGAVDVTKTGFNAVVTRTSTTDTRVDWIAFGKM